MTPARVTNIGGSAQNATYTVEVLQVSGNFSANSIHLHGTLQYLPMPGTLRRKNLYSHRSPSTSAAAAAAILRQPPLATMGGDGAPASSVNKAFWFEGKCIQALYRMASAARSKLRELSTAVASADPSGGAEVHGVSTKSIRRFIEKAAVKYAGDHSRVLDIARVTVGFKTFAGLWEGMKTIKEWATAGRIRVMRGKNRLHDAYDASVEGGYRDVLLNVELELELEGGVSTSFICEIQLTLVELLDVKRTGGKCSSFLLLFLFLFFLIFSLLNF